MSSIAEALFMGAHLGHPSQKKQINTLPRLIIANYSAHPTAIRLFSSTICGGRGLADAREVPTVEL
jgi:hypothetical protein